MRSLRSSGSVGGVVRPSGRAALSRKQPAWVWTLFNGIAALVLGILVYRGWSYSSFSILGFFFGINLVFKGAAQFALGVAPRTSSAAAA